ncbi:hypothetical protein A0H81_02643 [Grifola frondosa]|uniref:Trichodiene synthase n=1 Tax=Grifola frondosa TaxID=5627 RepID=A0A1C7MLG5_GRIFR|nr:hypothetical protein A0H81_02643 [Grifola frondosa]
MYGPTAGPLAHPLTKPYSIFTEERKFGYSDIRYGHFLRYETNYPTLPCEPRLHTPHTRPNLELRHRLATQMELWESSLSPAFKYKLNEESCNIAEMTYGHTSTDHQYFIALFTACTIYADDHCACDPEPVGQFAERFAHGERQLDPVLDCLADHIKTAYEFWPAIGATAIISSTLDFMTAVYVENTKAITPTPLAPRFPYYFRSLSGLSPSYAYFIFPKSWRTGINSYLQLIPELCFTLNCANDVLSFYKECVAGETDNYINLCATAEQKTPTAVLRDLANEVADTIRRVEALAAGDGELAVFCYKFFMASSCFWQNFADRF